LNRQIIVPLVIFQVSGIGMSTVCCHNSTSKLRLVLSTILQNMSLNLFRDITNSRSVSDGLSVAIHLYVPSCLNMKILVLEVCNLCWYTESKRFPNLSVMHRTGRLVYMDVKSCVAKWIPGVLRPLVELHLSWNLFTSLNSRMIQDFLVFLFDTWNTIH